MRFHYTAFQKNNRLVEGDIDARSKSEVLQFLAKRGLKPIEIRAATSGERGGRIRGRITLTDKVFLTRYISLMLKTGTDLFSAIDILIADFDKPAMKSFLADIRRDLEKGNPFYSSFERHPKYFSNVFVNLVKAGEASGNLDKVFGDLSISLEKENELRARVKGAFIYPILLLVLAVVILTFLVTFALPRIAEVFTGGGFEPPLFSRVVFDIGLFLEKYIWLILAAGILILLISGFFFFKTRPGRRMLFRIINFLPILRPIVSKLALQRFASTLSSLLKSGMPIVESLEITANAVGNEQVAASLMRIADKGVAQGLTLGEAFKRETSFPKVVVNLIAVSEKSGHLDEILDTLSRFYETEIDRALKTLVSILEPALLILIGIVVAVIALSIIVPIYQLVGQF